MEIGKGEKVDVEKPGTYTMGMEKKQKIGEQLKGRRWGLKAADIQSTKNKGRE